MGFAISHSYPYVVCCISILADLVAAMCASALAAAWEGEEFIRRAAQKLQAVPWCMLGVLDLG